MNNLAIAYVTCDKYEHIWEEWHDAFIEHWQDWDIPVYWCGEEKMAIDDDFLQIFHPCVEADHWTSKLRTQVEQIPEEYIFVWLDDGIPQMNISKEFKQLYEWLFSMGGDSMRIMYRSSKARYEPVMKIMDKPLSKLARNSRYRVSFTPNVYKKEFLLEALKVDQSPWACELSSSGKFPNRDIYAYHIEGWMRNGIVQ